MSHGSRAPSWWHTIPGVLTAVAALITAVSGFLLAVHQAGWLRGYSPEIAAEASESLRSEGGGLTPETRSPTLSSDRAAPALVPSMSQISLGQARYSLLDVQLEPQSPQSFALSIAVRMTSHSSHAQNFWDASFRLFVDDVPRAPVSNLNKVVAGHSAEDGVVRFVVPQGAESLVLQIRHNAETALIPLERSRH